MSGAVQNLTADFTISIHVDQASTSSMMIQKPATIVTTPVMFALTGHPALFHVTKIVKHAKDLQ